MPEAFTVPITTSYAGVDAGLGYRAPAVQQAAGVTYRQLDYWARTGLIEPSIRSAAGSGSQRLYSFTDVVTVRVIKRLLDTGVSLQNVRIAVDHLRARGQDDLATLTLVCDGVSVYECTTDEEIVDLLRGGQGVFGIAIGHTATDVAAVVRHLPFVKAADTVADDVTRRHSKDAAEDFLDDLSVRRARRSA
ncbi:MerR family transcriptional regulator [Rhodococcus sp. NPDC076796]|uniref:MerR family transcriptional regulator n=1 Tax=Rhodococcus sp. NPDC076796 TaxID=3154859 RepID=UPI00344C061F